MIFNWVQHTSISLKHGYFSLRFDIIEPFHCYWSEKDQPIIQYDAKFMLHVCPLLIQNGMNYLGYVMLWCCIDAWGIFQTYFFCKLKRIIKKWKPIYLPNDSSTMKLMLTLPERQGVKAKFTINLSIWARRGFLLISKTL